MFNVDDLAYINAYRKSMTSGGNGEVREPVIFGKDVKETEPFKLIALSDEQKFAVERAKKYALEQSIQNAVRKQMDQLQTQDMNSIKQTQALVLLSRIYVGSISFEVGEEEIRKSFSSYGPIKSIALSWDSALQKHKGFAFVEFEVPEAASLVIEQMNGFMIAGRGIKVGRPSNAPQTASLENELRQDPGNKCRVYVAGVHPQLSEADIQTVFEAFGAVRSCYLEPDVKFGQPGVQHKGYGWIEFESEQAAIGAVANVNGFEIAGSLLRVGRAITPRAQLSAPSGPMSVVNIVAQTQAVHAAAASISARVAQAESQEQPIDPSEDIVMAPPVDVTAPKAKWGAVGAVLPPPGVYVPPDSLSSIQAPTGVAAPAVDPALETNNLGDGDGNPGTSTTAPLDYPAEGMQAAYSPSATSPTADEPSGSASNVLLLENMVDPNEVDQYLEEEVSEECSNFGTVIRVIVHNGSATVRIFVQFDSRDAAMAGLAALNGRFFGGRQIAARLYPDEDFQMRNLDL